mmetsp:Transcript_25487/g.47874  ORF Transcript_25487/g.47874 Transcript_25487/m.47874 type:complete len:94 (+) Transcript_25487:150-431(+)
MLGTTPGNHNPWFALNTKTPSSLAIFDAALKVLLYMAFGSDGGKGCDCTLNFTTSQGFRRKLAIAFAVPPAASSSTTLSFDIAGVLQGQDGGE